MFYSYCFHHSGEIPPQTGYRKKIEEGGIDEFVTLISSDDFMQIRSDYTGNTLGNHVGIWSLDFKTMWKISFKERNDSRKV